MCQIVGVFALVAISATFISYACVVAGQDRRNMSQERIRMEDEAQYEWVKTFSKHRR